MYYSPKTEFRKVGLFIIKQQEDLYQLLKHYENKQLTLDLYINEIDSNDPLRENLTGILNDNHTILNTIQGINSSMIHTLQKT